MCQTLKNEELTTKLALTLITEKDLQSLGLPMGATKLIVHNLKQWNKNCGIQNVNVCAGISGAGRTTVNESLKDDIQENFRFRYSISYREFKNSKKCG